MTFVRYLETLRVHFTIVDLKNAKYHFELRDLFKSAKFEKDQD